MAEAPFFDGRDALLLVRMSSLCRSGGGHNFNCQCSFPWEGVVKNALQSGPGLGSDRAWKWLTREEPEGFPIARDCARVCHTRDAVHTANSWVLSRLMLCSCLAFEREL